jgi:hypothetical protein
MLQFNKDNIELFESLIFDSDLFVKDLPLKTIDDCIYIIIERPYWEKPIQKRWLNIKLTKVKRQKSIITFFNVFNPSYEWKDNALEKDDDYSPILNIEVDKNRNTLVFDSSITSMKITFKDDIRIQLKDYGRPLERNMLNIIGWNTFDYQKWKNTYDQLGDL